MVTMKLGSDISNLGNTIHGLVELLDELEQDASVKTEHLDGLRQIAHDFAIIYVHMWIKECVASIAIVESETFLRRQAKGVHEVVIEHPIAETLREAFGHETLHDLVQSIQGILRAGYAFGFNDMELTIHNPVDRDDAPWIGFREAPT